MPDGLTPRFVTGILRKHGCLPPGSSVSKVEREVVGEGTGMMTELARLSLAYAGNPGDAPPSLIAKFSTRNETNRAVAMSFNLPERETRFAAELAPRTETVTPQIYCALLQGDRFLLAMEDLGDYDPGSQAEGAGLRQTELAIDELAKLHGAFWNQVDDLDWVPGIARSYHADALMAGAVGGWDNMVRTFGVPDHIDRHKANFFKAIPRLQEERMQPPVTLAHGDYRMENLLYGNRPDHHDVVVIDWQGPLKARGMFDVALFLGQSATIEVRRAHERPLLQRYVDGLRACGVEGVTGAGVWEDYLRCTLYNWIYTAIVAGTLDSSNETAANWMSQMVARQVAVSDDHQVFDYLPGYLPD